MAIDVNPLTEKDLEEINEALRNAKIAQDQIELAKRADIDVGNQEELLKQAVDKLLKIKQVYFPGA